MVSITLRCEKCEYDLEISDMDFTIPMEGDDNEFGMITSWYYVCPKCKDIFKENVLTGGKEEYRCKKCDEKMLEIEIEPPPYGDEEYYGEYTAPCPICKKTMKVRVVTKMVQVNSLKQKFFLKVE